MPDLISIGLGGGSIVRWDQGGNVQIGPESVGHAIQREALCFGGNTLTMTDVAVARGMAQLGDPSRIDVSPDVLERVYARAVAMIEDAVDRMKTSAADVPLIAVGGGSILLPETLSGVSEVHKPAHFDVANAIGAAISQVSGEVDRVFALENRSREDALRSAQEQAFSQAVRAGADPGSLELIELEEIPLAYLPGNAVRLKAKVAGRLKTEA
jgi:N-methylhydantoinase A/oxoprolinase/acetone carboxylase beta subunit